MKRRLLYLADVRFPIERANGIQTMETCAALAGRGHDVTLAVRPDSARPARDPFAFYALEPIESLRIVTVPAGGPPAVRRLAYLAGALRLVARSPRDTILFTRDLGLASLLLRARAVSRRAVVYESHGFAPVVSQARPGMLSGAPAASTAKQRRLAAREARVWRDADGYITITRALADELTERFGPRDALSVIHDGVRLEPDSTWCPPARHTPPVVGYAGHLYPWKGVDLLVEALGGLEGVHGLIVGGHPQERDIGRLRARLEELGIAARVRITGLVPPREVPALLDQADVLVLPNPPGEVSMRYTSPLKLFEYLASGRPVVASDLTAFREVLTDGHDAVLFEAGNVAALRGALSRVLGDATLAEELGRHGAETARDYTWARRAERIESLLLGI